MSQLTYASAPAVALPGQLADLGPNFKRSVVNGETSAIPHGIFVKRGAADHKVALLGSVADAVVGVVVHEHTARPTDTTTGVGASSICSLLDRGVVYVKVEDAVTQGGRVYARCVANGTGKLQLGACRGSQDGLVADGSPTCKLIPGARFLSSAAEGGLAMVAFDALESQRGDQASFAYDHAQATQDTTVKFAKTHPERSFVVEKVQYINPTGLAEDANNYFDVSIKNGTTVLANRNTKTGEGGTIAADTFVDLVNTATGANLTLPPGTVLSLVLDETGTATLPAGRVVVHGRYV